MSAGWRHFGHVLILERDALQPDTLARPGIPRGRHVHGLLAGGLAAPQSLLPDLRGGLLAAGALPFRLRLDQRLEAPGFDPFGAPRILLGRSLNYPDQDLRRLAAPKPIKARPNSASDDGSGTASKVPVSAVQVTRKPPGPPKLVTSKSRVLIV